MVGHAEIVEFVEYAVRRARNSATEPLSKEELKNLRTQIRKLPFEYRKEIRVGLAMLVVCRMCSWDVVRRLTGITLGKHGIRQIKQDGDCVYEQTRQPLLDATSKELAEKFTNPELQELLAETLTEILSIERSERFAVWALADLSYAAHEILKGFSRTVELEDYIERIDLRIIELDLEARAMAEELYSDLNEEALDALERTIRRRDRLAWYRKGQKDRLTAQSIPGMLSIINERSGALDELAVIHRRIADLTDGEALPTVRITRRSRRELQADAYSAVARELYDAGSEPVATSDERHGLYEAAGEMDKRALEALGG